MRTVYDVDELWMCTDVGHCVDRSLLDIRIDTVCMRGSLMYELCLGSKMMWTGGRKQFRDIPWNGVIVEP